VVALNRTVAVAQVRGPARALAEVEELEKDARLAGYQYLPAIRAELLCRLGRAEEAAPVGLVHRIVVGVSGIVAGVSDPPVGPWASRRRGW
jgi:hypothetical protein